MAEEGTPAKTDALERAMAMIHLRRLAGYLTVHALKKAEGVLKWELAGERDKALAKLRNVGSQNE